MRTNEERKKHSIGGFLFCSLLIFLFAGFIMTGCQKEDNSNRESERAKREEDTEIPDDEDDRGNADDAENEGVDIVDTDGALQERIIWSWQTIAYIEDNGELTEIYRATEDTPGIIKTISEVIVLDEENIFVHERESQNSGYLQNSINWTSKDTIFCMDSSGNRKETVATICDETEVKMQFLKDNLYVTYCHIGGEETGWTNQFHWYVYEQQDDGSYMENENAICRKLRNIYERGYSYCDHANGLTLLREMNLLIVWDDSTNSLVAFNSVGDIEWQIQPGDDVTWLNYMEDGYFYASVYEGSSPKNNFYHLSADGELELIDIGEQDVSDIIAIEGETLYFADEIYDDNGYITRPVSSMKMGEQEPRHLFDEESFPGQARYGYTQYGVKQGFFVCGDYCYFISQEPGVAGWYSCSLTDATPTRSELLLEEISFPGTYDMGDITWDSRMAACPDCGEMICHYYYEKFTLSESAIPNAEIINRVLDEYFRAKMEYAENAIASVLNDFSDYHSCNDSAFSYKQTGDGYFGGATEFTFLKDGEEHTYLQIYEYGYEYWGGSHGYPIREYLVFSEETGEKVDLGQVLGVDEDVFSTLAAEYTLQDYRIRTEREEYLYYDYGEEELYQNAFDSAGFAAVNALAAEGVVVMYSPYDLGPYASGYIEVLIPYEEFDVTLTDIYGAAEYDYNY
ncbi:MAG: DUF3298 domain-containing protein [Lachnospiraceae bacterium]